jgi:hypothetical protein
MIRVQTLRVSRYPANLAAGLLVSFGGALALALASRMFTPATSTVRDGRVMFYGYLLYFSLNSLWRIGYRRQDQIHTLRDCVTPRPNSPILSHAVPLFVLTTTGAARYWRPST